MAVYTAPTFVNSTSPPIDEDNLNDLALCAQNSQTLVFQNVSVQTSAFVADSTFTNWGYRAAIPLTGIDTTYIANVVFGPDDADSGLYSNVTQTYAGGVYIYAKSAPSATITILAINCVKGANL